MDWNWWKAIHASVSLVCLSLFFFNSYKNTLQYFSNEKTMTQRVDHQTTGILPGLTFCNYSGFKTLGSVTAMDDYIRNTIEPREIFVSDEVIDSLIQSYSRYVGRCYTYYHKAPVKSQEDVFIKLQNSALVKIFIHDTAAEFGVFLDYWSDTQPTLKIDPFTAMLDIQVEKSVSIVETDDCIKEEGYKMLGDIFLIHNIFTLLANFA